MREAHETSFQGHKTSPWSPNKQGNLTQEAFLLVHDTAAQAAAHCRADKRGLEAQHQWCDTRSAAEGEP